MKYFVTVNGREHEVELVERLANLSVTLDGEPVEMRYEEVDELGQVGLFLGNKSYAVSIEGGAEKAVVTVAGHPYAVTIEDERERIARQAERVRSRGGGELTSVMPGVVVELLVAEGDEVEEGQPLLILEAMKMQNEIRAPAAGKVVRLYVSREEAVTSGAKLLSLKGEE